jgi:hypothetical protein
MYWDGNGDGEFDCQGVDTLEEEEEMYMKMVA